MGKLHVSLAHQLMENVEHIVRDFRESQREKRKKVEICCFCEYSDTVMKALMSGAMEGPQNSCKASANFIFI